MNVQFIPKGRICVLLSHHVDGLEDVEDLHQDCQAHVPQPYRDFMGPSHHPSDRFHLLFYYLLNNPLDFCTWAAFACHIPISITYISIQEQLFCIASRSDRNFICTTI